MSTTFKNFKIFSALIFIMSLAVFFDSCTDPVGGIDPCETVNCGPNGDCLLSATGDPFCNCDAGFSGANCETADDPCANCPTNSTCVTDSVTGEQSCECDLGFGGVDCQDVVDVCDTCPTNSTCVTDSVTGEQFCECDLGYEGNDCEIEIRSKFLGTFSGKVDYAEGDPFTDFTENVTVTADPSNVEQFFINSFEDFSIPAAERFSITAKVRPLDQDANTFEIIGSYTKNYILDNVEYRTRYSGVGLGTVNITSGRIVVEYMVEDINPSTGNVLSTLNAVLTLAPL
ncbi:MAG: hypothetical protein ACPGVB_04085 [Chitinophagales bacterium]